MNKMKAKSKTIETLESAKKIICGHLYPHDRSFLMRMSIEMIEYVNWRAKHSGSSKANVIRQAILEQMKLEMAEFRIAETNINKLITDIFDFKGNAKSIK